MSIETFSVAMEDTSASALALEREYIALSFRDGVARMAGCGLLARLD